METLNFREILTKEPFSVVLPAAADSIYSHRSFLQGDAVAVPEDRPQRQVITQADFLRQYYPSGHKINSTAEYPDIYRQDPETKQWHKQEVTRCAFAFQQLIATKQIVHICGNDVCFELATQDDPQTDADDARIVKDTNTLRTFIEGWNSMSMMYHFYEAIDAIKKTGDGAVVFFFDKGKPKAKALSYMDGDTLYPHYNALSGELDLFARKYYAFDTDGTANTEYVEVWDNEYMYSYKRGLSKGAVAGQKIKDFFGISGYTLVNKCKHGFNRVPVAYYRDPVGACWLPSQDTIEQYEESFSYFVENNKATAFPIFYVKGDGVELAGDELTGAVKAVTIPDKDGEAGFLSQTDVSAAYNTQLKTLYDLIYEQSFAVKPPELNSGDLPGVAVKLLYSPAIEKAIVDCQRLQSFLDELVYFVKFGWGFEKGNQLELVALKINAWIEPYIHQNDTELTTNLATAVQNKFLSMQTASERFTKFSKNDEATRVVKEDVAKRQREFDFKQKEQDANTQASIKEMEAQAKTNTFHGSDINTGGNRHKGRPNRTGKQWDDQGNYPGRNNWNRF